MSRQTIDNLLGVKQHFGLEGLAQGYSPSTSKSRGKQREIHASKNKGIPGNKAKQLAEIRKEAKEKRELEQQSFNFTFGYDAKAEAVADEDQPYAEEHDWVPTRYAGVFIYLITLIKSWDWLTLVKGYFGFTYKIFMIFVLMSARNIRSIEQPKKCTPTGRRNITWHKKNPKQTYLLAVVLQSSRETNIDSSQNEFFSVSDMQWDCWNMVMVYRRTSLALYG